MTPPAVAEPFYWTQEEWGAALRCRPLDEVAPHVFSGRLPSLHPATLGGLAHSIGARHLVAVTQIHGAAVAVCRPDEPLPLPAHEADIVVAHRIDAGVSIRSADCVPVLLADRRTGAVAAVHAGWRGTRSGASAAAVEALRREFGSRPEDLVAAIGPHIGACCYRIGTDVVDAFAAAGFARHLVDRWFPVHPPARGSTVRPPLHLDLGRANQDQLVLAGVPEERIHRCLLCTAEHLDVLTSFRAEGAQASRLIAAIRASGEVPS